MAVFLRWQALPAAIRGKWHDKKPFTWGVKLSSLGVQRFENAVFKGPLGQLGKRMMARLIVHVPYTNIPQRGGCSYYGENAKTICNFSPTFWDWRFEKRILSLRGFRDTVVGKISKPCGNSGEHCSDRKVCKAVRDGRNFEMM
jgi:hypothetical protein